jgi:hypothetical protein
VRREPQLTRRGFLGRVGRGAAAGFATPALVAALVACRRDPELADELGAFFSDSKSARQLGRACLAAFPDENDARILVERLAGADLARWNALAAEARSELAAAVRSRHRDDFASGRVVRVRGWVLSETEARLCALAALA